MTKSPTIRELRGEEKQESFAKLAGISLAALKKIEAGERVHLRGRTIIGIAKASGKTYDDILESNAETIRRKAAAKSSESRLLDLAKCQDLKELNAPDKRAAHIADMAPALPVANRSEAETQFISYYHWHEQRLSFEKGSGIYQSFTQGEIEQLWSNQAMYLPYETMLYGLRRLNFDIHRIFIADIGALACNRRHLAIFLGILFRHEFLGFVPRILTPVDLSDAAKTLGFTCEGASVLNSRIAMLLKVDGWNEPRFLRTTNKTFATKLSNLHYRWWGNAVTVDRFVDWAQQAAPLKLDAIRKKAEREASFVKGTADKFSR